MRRIRVWRGVAVFQVFCVARLVLGERQLYMTLLVEHLRLCAVMLSRCLTVLVLVILGVRFFGPLPFSGCEVRFLIMAEQHHGSRAQTIPGVSVLHASRPTVQVPDPNEAMLARLIEGAMQKCSSQILSTVTDKFDSFKRELGEQGAVQHEDQLHEIKRIKVDIERHSFRSKGNEEQFKFNRKVANTMEDARRHLAEQKFDAVVEDIKEGEKLISQRQKLILIADKSEHGWATANEYVKDELASDSEDEKRLYKAESRAKTKVRDARTKKQKNFNFRKPVQQWGGQASQSSRPGNCFACGRPGHWRSECRLFKFMPGNQSASNFQQQHYQQLP